MLKTKLFKTLGSVITAAALLISSQASVFAETENEDTFEYPSLAASYDFAKQTGNGITVRNSSNGEAVQMSVENGAGKMEWFHNIYTDKAYKNAVVEFDYKISPEKPENVRDDAGNVTTWAEVRLDVHFGKGDGNADNWSYIDFIKGDGGVPHYVASYTTYQDQLFNISEDAENFKFYQETEYSFRYVVNGNSVQLYAKHASDTVYTYIGEMTGLDIPSGLIYIHSSQFAYIKNLKVYADAVKVSVADGETVSSELANITVTLPHETAVNNSQIKLTQNGNKVGYTFAQSGKTLTITPILKPNKTYVLWLSEDIAGETGGVSITFNTMPAVSASWDFENDLNNGFDVQNNLTLTNGEGKMSWDTKIITKNNYQHAILDFDYRLESLKGERRFNVGFGANENGVSNNFCYIDIDGTTQPRLHQSNGDYLFENGSGFVFKDSVTYSYRYIVNSNSVKFYAKETTDAEYTFIGEVTGLNIPNGRMTIDGKEYGYIKNLKVYGYDSENYDYVIKNAAYDPQSKKFTADITALSDTAPDAKATVASYSENGLKDVKIVDLPANEKVDLTLDEGSEYKVIVLNNFGDLEPVAECITFN